VLADYIALSEGRRNRMYLDTRGIQTIGIGFNLTRSGARAAITAVGANFDRIFSGADTLSEAQIDQLFAPDMEAAIAGGRRVVSAFAQQKLSRQILIVDMVFNLGEAGFAAFRNAIAAIARADYEAAANEMQNSAWFRQVGDRGPRNVLAMRTGALLPRFQESLNAIERAGALATGQPFAEKPLEP
jgi:lysozyme